MGRLPPLLVVFDVNIYLDVARWVGPPYSNQKLQIKLLQHRQDPSTPVEVKIQSAKLASLCSSGVFAGNQKLQVWTSDWINNVAVRVAMRSRGEKGLGWSETNAELIRTDLIHGTVVGPSNGFLLNSDKTAKFEDLDWDDAQVLTTALQARVLSPSSTTICVTNDKAFRNTNSCGDVTMLTSPEFLSLITAARQALRKSIEPI